MSQGYETPGVLLLSNPNQNPLETIIFSVFPEEFAHQNDFSNFIKHLAWFSINCRPSVKPQSWQKISSHCDCGDHQQFPLLARLGSAN